MKSPPVALIPNSPCLRSPTSNCGIERSIEEYLFNPGGDRTEETSLRVIGVEGQFCMSLFVERGDWERVILKGDEICELGEEINEFGK